MHTAILSPNLLLYCVLPKIKKIQFVFNPLCASSVILLYWDYEVNGKLNSQIQKYIVTNFECNYIHFKYYVLYF